MFQRTYRVYALPDEQGRVTDVRSDAFLADPTGWTLIDEGAGDRFLHAQSNYLPGPLTDEHGIPRYQLLDGQIHERSSQDIEMEYIGQESAPTQAARIAELEKHSEMLTACLLELSEILYA